MTNFATLKKSSSTLDRLIKEIEKANAPASDKKSGDDRFWKLERDKSGNGSAVIRFLPNSQADGEDGIPWIRYFDHGFKGPTGKWYIENSLTSLEDKNKNKTKDPAGEYNSYLWNLSEDENSWSRKQARNQKRRLHYISNIYVISDPKNPENEGKVFLFKYGKKIFDKITMAMNPEFEGDEKINPFDFWKGANFKIRIRTVDGYPNYEQSVFDAPKPLSNDDEAIESIWNKQYYLKEFLAPSNFKTYDQLKARLDEVLAEDPAYLEFTGDRTRAPQAQTVKQATPAKRVTVEDNDAPPFDIDDDDDDLKAFKSLAMS
jgi:hypothetical protein